MKPIPDEVAHFLHKQNFVILTTIDKNGNPHSVCKGIIGVNNSGIVELLDLYVGDTRKNLALNPHISIVAVDEHSFVGYCLKGTAKTKDIDSEIEKEWSNKIVSRISHRIIKKIHGERGHPKHPEIHLPQPKYMIVMDVEEIIDLTPGHLK